MGRWGFACGGGDGAAGGESAVECLGGGSGGDGRALPNGSHGGKARSDAVKGHLEGVCALCLRWGRDGRCGILS